MIAAPASVIGSGNSAKNTKPNSVAQTSAV
jgi:hypothetical protein